MSKFIKRFFSVLRTVSIISFMVLVMGLIVEGIVLLLVHFHWYSVPLVMLLVTLFITVLSLVVDPEDY